MVLKMKTLKVKVRTLLHASTKGSGMQRNMISRLSGKKSMDGAALFLVMILILVMSTLTFNSLKGTTLYTRLASNQVATERTFQAAESVIDRVYAEGKNPNSEYFKIALLAGVQNSCLTQEDFQSKKCSNNDAFDSYGHAESTLYAAAETRYLGDIQASGYDAQAFVFKHFETHGGSFYSPSIRINFASENRLHWKRFGPRGGFVRAQ